MFDRPVREPLEGGPQLKPRFDIARRYIESAAVDREVGEPGVGAVGVEHNQEIIPDRW